MHQINPQAPFHQDLSAAGRLAMHSRIMRRQNHGVAGCPDGRLSFPGPRQPGYLRSR